MKNKKLMMYILSLGLTIVIIVALAVGSYAYIRTYREQDKYNQITTLKCISLTLTSNSEEGITLMDTYPIPTTEGKTLVPYTFTIKNVCSTAATAKVNLEILNTTTIASDSSIRVMIGKTGTIVDTALLSSFTTATPTLDNAARSYTIYTNSYLSVGSSQTLDLRLWLDESATNTELDKTFQAILTVTE